MSKRAFTKTTFPRRNFLQSGVLSLGCSVFGVPLEAFGQTMKPMAKRMPTAAESEAVRDYHAKRSGYLFEESFQDRAAFESRWTVFLDNRSDLLACRTADSLAISGEGLSINTVSANHCTAKWSTGQIISKQAFLYGLYEAYIDIAHGVGVDNAFWLTSQGTVSDGTGDSFEIDIAEIYYPALVRTTLHRHNLTKGIDRYETGYDYRPQINLAAGFHDYGVLWTPEALVFCFDGVAYLTIETQGTVNVPTNLRLSTALSKQFGGAPPAVPTGLTMHASHVRVIGL
jgi:beta-glucanase (GH16 family)